MWVLLQEKLQICCQDTEHSQSRCGKLNQQSILLSLFLQKIQKGVVMKDSCLNKFPVSRKFLITYSLVNQLECNNYLIAYGTLQRICKATHKTRTPPKKDVPNTNFKIQRWAHSIDSFIPIASQTRAGDQLSRAHMEHKSSNICLSRQGLNL